MRAVSEAYRDITVQCWTESKREGERTEAGGQERGRGSGKAREHGEKEGGRLWFQSSGQHLSSFGVTAFMRYY